MKLYQKINEIKVNLPKVNANRIIMESLDINLTELHDFLHKDLEQHMLTAIDKAILATSKNMPLSRVFNRRYFYKDVFYVSPYTLDPRPETESIVEYIGANLIPESILDMGTGTGCILLSIMRDFPDSYGCGIDISKYAIETSIYNANKLSIKAEFIVRDFSDPMHKKFDLIVSNPPYISTECSYEAMFDPPISLWDNCCYEKLIRSDNLTDTGSLILECPTHTKDKIISLTDKNSLNIVNMEKIGHKLILIHMQKNKYLL
jgi:HemK-like putative methylase